MHRPVNLTIDDDMVRLDFAGYMGRLRYHQNARLVSLADNIAAEFTVESKSIGKTEIAGNLAPMGYQALDEGLFLSLIHI